MHISNDIIQKAREMDLLTYLQNYEPHNLVHLSRDNYCTREHDSLKISNGMWYWFSRGFGGVCALDYLIKVQNYSLPQAVEMILGRAAIETPSFSYVDKKNKPRQLLMPDLVSNPKKVKEYLISRGIHPTIIEYCLMNSLLFESAKYHNAIFIGYDKNGIARYGSMRGTTTNYKGEVTGSNKHYSFNISGTGDTSHLHLFESAIDLLSYGSLQLMKGEDWREESMLSLAGVFETKRKDVLPVALKQYLKEYPEVKTIHLHLDNDEVGRGAVVGIRNALGDKYTIFDEPPDYRYKDVNEQLKAKVEARKKEARER